jgi:catalase (peroxidase I)
MYYQRIRDNDATDIDLLWLPTDAALQASPELRSYVITYANDNDAFLRDYALAHKKMSELGAFFEREGGIVLDSVASSSTD